MEAIATLITTLNHYDSYPCMMLTQSVLFFPVNYESNGYSVDELHLFNTIQNIWHITIV